MLRAALKYNISNISYGWQKVLSFTNLCGICESFMTFANNT